MGNDTILTEDGRFVKMHTMVKTKGSSAPLEYRLEQYKAEVKKLSDELAIIKNDSWRISSEKAIDKLSADKTKLQAEVKRLMDSLGEEKNKNRVNKDLQNEVVTLRETVVKLQAKSRPDSKNQS